jgi:hypothetical protein
MLYFSGVIKKIQKMKKLLSLLLVGVIFTSTTFAQPKTAKQEVKKVEAAKPAASPKKAEAAKPAQAAPAKKVEAVKPASKTKADGTPDMRFKENKDKKADAKPAAGPMKKDGTPDMRFKDNKDKKAPAKKG